MDHFAIHLKLTQHCKSTMLQFKKKWAQLKSGELQFSYIVINQTLYSRLPVLHSARENTYSM